MHRVGEKLEDLPPFLQEVEVRILQAEFIVPTPSQVTHYSKPERAEPPESSQPSDGGCRGVSILIQFDSNAQTT